MTMEQPKGENEIVLDVNWTERELGIIAGLKEKGPEDQDALAAFVAWLQEREQESDSQDIAMSEIEFNLRVAQLKIASGLLEEAWDDLNVVRDQSFKMGSPGADLFAKTEALMDQLEPYATRFE